MRMYTDKVQSPTARAAELMKQAQHERAIAEENQRKGLPGWEDECPFRLDQAERLEAEARDLMKPDREFAAHQSGEFLSEGSSPSDSWALAAMELPVPQLAADASYRRQDLLMDGGALELGLDAAAGINPRNSLEMMLAHQMAGIHQLAMRFMTKAGQQVERISEQDTHGNQPKKLTAQAEVAAKLGNTAARMMNTFQQGLQTLARTRRGGKQEVKVVHVHQQVAVGQGGRALVAGTTDIDGGDIEWDQDES